MSFEPHRESESRDPLRDPMDVTPVFAALLSRNSSPSPDSPGQYTLTEYRLAATLDQNTIHLSLTFRSGCNYCCAEPGCHVPFAVNKRWNSIRAGFANSGIAVPERLKLKIRVEIEAGAMFFDFSRPDPSRRGWYAFEESKPHSFVFEVEEAPRESHTESEPEA